MNSEKISVGIFFAIFLCTIVLSFLIPQGFYVFVLTAFPLILLRDAKKSISFEITMLIFIVIAFIGSSISGFSLDSEQIIFVFSPTTGYLVARVSMWVHENGDAPKKTKR